MSGPPSRGAALLMVLATLVILATATTILASNASWLQTQALIDHCTLFADDFHSAAEAPIQEWLSSESSKVVLPPEAVQPAIGILNDRLVINDLTCQVQITAWDQCGMIPFEMVANGSPLRQAIPVELLDLIDALRITSQDHFGLDQLVPTVLPLSDEGVYPSFHERTATPLAVGAMIATHNTAPSRINVNTAPRALLEHSLLAAGRGGLEQIIQSRDDGEVATVAGEVSRRDGVDPTLIPQLVTTSDRWSFRIDVSIGPVRKSWWAVYAPMTGRLTKGMNQYKWKCVQRLVISH
jgi:hypothetical protein